MVYVYNVPIDFKNNIFEIMKEPPINTYTLEICSNSFYSAKQAQLGGASRIELCQNLENGGTTPSYGQIQLARKHLSIGIHVLIRPRSGDFLYNDDEFHEMIEDIRFCRKIGCDGVVIGLLDQDGQIDKRRTEILVKEAGPLTPVFHRAFDRCVDPVRSLEDIIETGCQRLLTSGQQGSAWAGRELIRDLIEQAQGRIEIMPGAGIDESNIKEILRYTGASSVHSSAKVRVESQMTFKPDSFTGMDEDVLQTSRQRVEGLIDKIKSL